MKVHCWTPAQVLLILGPYIVNASPDNNMKKSPLTPSESAIGQTDPAKTRLDLGSEPCRLVRLATTVCSAGSTDGVFRRINRAAVCTPPHQNNPGV